jgi:hypothetical protein
MRRRYTPVAVSAPSSFRRPPAATSFAARTIGFTIVLAIAVLAAGCAAPGASRLQGAPESMPPALEHVTADVLGFSVYDTDPGSDAWGSTGLDAEAALDQLYERVGVDAAEVEPWIGAHAGVAVRQLDVPGTEGGTWAWWADVRDPEALLESVEALEGDGRSVQAYPDGVLVATSEAALEDFTDAAESYAVSERKAMREYAAEVATKSPVGVVFRGDLLRTHLRRPFQGDPALLEFARWATESNVLLAARDGWVGAAAPVADDRDGFRLVGNVEWVPDLAPDIDWGSVDADLLDEVDASADLAVAIEDPGQHLQELLTGITRKNGQYATEQDVPDGEDRVELEPLLEELDGDAAIGWNGASRTATLRINGAADQAEDVELVLDRLGLDAQVDAVWEDLVVKLVGVEVGSDGFRTRATAAKAAGPPPRPPVAWVWTRSIAGCSGPAAGWVTFDGAGEMSFSLAVSTADACDLAGRLADLP